MIEIKTRLQDADSKNSDSVKSTRRKDHWCGVEPETRAPVSDCHDPLLSESGLSIAFQDFDADISGYDHSLNLPDFIRISWSTLGQAEVLGTVLSGPKDYVLREPGVYRIEPGLYHLHTVVATKNDSGGGFAVSSIIW